MGGYARLAEPLAKQIEADLAHARLVAAAPGQPTPVQANCIVLNGQAAGQPAEATVAEAAQ
jgi:hypothetical protein